MGWVGARSPGAQVGGSDAERKDSPLYRRRGCSARGTPGCVGAGSGGDGAQWVGS